MENKLYSNTPHNNIHFLFFYLKVIEEHALYFNEKDIEKKLEDIKIHMDRITGEPRYIKELNELGKRKPKVEACKNENKSPQSKVDIINI